LNDIIEKKVYLDNGKGIIQQHFTDILDILMEKQEHGSNFLIRNALLETIFNANNKSSYGGFYAFVFFLKYSKWILKNKIAGNLEDISIENKVSDMCSLSRACNLDTMISILKSHTSDDFIRNIIESATALAGFDGQIYINDKAKDNNCLELIMGNKFNISPHEAFINTGKLKTWERNDVCCIIIDGIVEKVSELDNILSKLSQNKRPAVIFARGFGEEVVATLLANFLKETLDVIPFKVAYDLRGANMLKDIAVCVNGDVVSSLKGELITTIDVDESPFAESFAIGHKSIIIKNPDAALNTKLHIKELIKELDSSHMPEKLRLINERLSYMGTRCVTISLNEHNKERLKYKNDKIRNGIKLINDISQHGHINLSKLCNHTKLSNDPRAKPLMQSYKIFESLNLKLISSPSIVHGLISGYSLAKTISNCTIFVTSDS
tara:strand:- start:3203 stop:4513 length:1311 start_codon:yes stop_codon:yes gene_type:complete